MGNLYVIFIIDEDEKGPYILQSEVEKAIKEMREKMVSD
jgi:hypothetical protein